MSYTLEYIPDKEYIEIIILGRVNYSSAKEYSKEALKLARSNNCNKFLIDHSKTKVSGGIHKIYTDGNALEQFGFKVKDKIAIYIKCKKDNFLLLEAASKNIKWSDFRYFNSLKKALIWLNE
jgi:hypothetical protein